MALAEPLLSPRIIVPVPKALAVVPETVPAAIVSPPPKVLAPERVNVVL